MGMMLHAECCLLGVMPGDVTTRGNVCVFGPTHSLLPHAAEGPGRCSPNTARARAKESLVVAAAAAESEHLAATMAWPQPHRTLLERWWLFETSRSLSSCECFLSQQSATVCQRQDAEDARAAVSFFLCTLLNGSELNCFWDNFGKRSTFIFLRMATQNRPIPGIYLGDFKKS